MRCQTPIGLLAALLVALAACGADSDDDGSGGTADTGADVPFSPFDGQWEGTLTGPDGSVDVWVHFGLGGGGAIGLPCDYATVETTQDGDRSFNTRYYDRSGDRVAELFSTQAERPPDRARVSLNGFGYCAGQWTGYIYP